MATVNSRGPGGMHAPSRFPSLHRTPGPLSVPPFHLHLKGRRPRRLSLCSLPHSRNDLIYLFVNGNIRLGRGHPAAGVAAEGAADRRGTCGSFWDPGPNNPFITSGSTNTVTVFDSCDAGDFLPRTHAGGWGGGGTSAKQKLLCVSEVSGSHVWRSVTGWHRSN